MKDLRREKGLREDGARVNEDEGVMRAATVQRLRLYAWSQLRHQPGRHRMGHHHCAGIHAGRHSDVSVSAELPADTHGPGVTVA
jgi:hypothetical protein